jgi:hypothetical protein
MCVTRSADERRRRCTAARCWSTFKALATVSAVAFGIVCIVLMPDYRIYAAFVVCQALIVYFQLWRFTPCDRSRVNVIVEERIEEFLLSGKYPRQQRRGGTHRRDTTTTSSSARKHAARRAELSEDSRSDDAPSEKPRISKKSTYKETPRSSKKATTPRDAKKKKKALRRDVGSSDDGDAQLQRREAVDERTPTRPTRTPSFHIDPSGLLHAPYGGSPAGFLPSLMHHHNQQLTPYHHTPTHHQHHHGSPHFWTETSLPSVGPSYSMPMPTAPPQSSRGASLHGSPSSAMWGYLGRSPYGGGASGSKTPSKRRVVREIVSGDDDEGADDALARPYVLDMGFNG